MLKLLLLMMLILCMMDEFLCVVRVRVLCKLECLCSFERVLISIRYEKMCKYTCVCVRGYFLVSILSDYFDFSFVIFPVQARLDDSGKYLCWVNNTAGEETIQVTLTVTGSYFSIHIYLFELPAIPAPKQLSTQINRCFPFSYGSRDCRTLAANGRLLGPRQHH